MNRQTTPPEIMAETVEGVRRTIAEREGVKVKMWSRRVGSCGKVGEGQAA